MQNSPDIKILFGHQVRNGVGHRIGNRVGHAPWLNIEYNNSLDLCLPLGIFYLWMIHVFLWMIHGREYPEFECFHGRLEVGDGIGNPPTLQLLLRSRSLRLSNSHPKSFSWLLNTLIENCVLILN